MKETIRGINRFTDLTNQFFCYVNEHGDEIIFSRTMLNFAGYREIKNIREANILMSSECYLSHESLDGIDIFKIGTWNSDSVYLNPGLAAAVIRLTTQLQLWFRVEPNATIAEKNLPFFKPDGTLDLYKICVKREMNCSRLEDESVQHHELYSDSTPTLKKEDTTKIGKAKKCGNDFVLKATTSLVIGLLFCLTLWYALYGG